VRGGARLRRLAGRSAAGPAGGVIAVVRLHPQAPAAATAALMLAGSRLLNSYGRR
jgi:hypothetical protein